MSVLAVAGLVVRPSTVAAFEIWNGYAYYALRLDATDEERSEIRRRWLETCRAQVEVTGAWWRDEAIPRLAGLYETSCKACHAMPGNLAPQVHDRAAWDPRWKQGETVLLDHTIQGFNAMPAGGQCASCTPDDFKALIRFMAGR